MRAWVEIGSFEELERRGHLVARLGGREVGAVLDRARGSVHGIRNRCPHHGGPLCLGTVHERVAG